MRQSLRRKLPVLATVGLVLLSALPLGGAAGEDPYVCFTVVNAVGWPLQNIEVTAIRRAINNPGATVVATSSATGFVQMQLIRSTWSFTFRDLEAPTSPLRNGTVYLATALDSFSMPGSGGLVADACGPGVAGMPLSNGATPGKVAMLAPAVQGYLEVTVTDIAALNAPPLPGANVVAATVRPDNSGGTIPTDASGKVRIPCYLQSPNNITITKEGYLPVSQPHGACNLAEVNLRTIPLWRTPIHIEYTVSNDTSLARDMSGQTAVPRDTQPPSRVSTARVSVMAASPVLSSALVAANPSVCPSIAAAQPVAGGVTLDNRVPAFQSPLAGFPPPYICSAPTDTLGRATLILPWAEVGEYELSVSASGYDTTVKKVPISPAWLSAQDGNAPGRIHQAAITLARATVTLRGAVIDVHGDPMAGARVNFTQPGTPSGFEQAATPETGEFVLTLPSGDYTMSISKSGLATRTCAVQIGVGPGGAGRFSSPSTPLALRECLTLLPPNTAAVIGVVNDKDTGRPASGIQVCHGNANPLNCDTTSADGSWELQVAANAGLGGATGIRILSGQPWWAFEGALSQTTAGAVGTLRETAPKTANRTRIVTTIHVENSAGAPIEAADVTVLRGTTVVQHTNGDNKTGPDGNYTLKLLSANQSTLDSIWTYREGQPNLTLPAYVATAIKYRGSGNTTLYASTSSTAFMIEAAAPPTTVNIVMAAEIGSSASIAVSPIDAHTGLEAPLAELIAYSTDPSAAAGPVSIVKGVGTLQLYEKFAPYRVCPRATVHYREELVWCAENVIPGQTGPLQVRVNRTLTNITLRGVDAHTNWALAAYNVTAVGQNGLTCNPQGALPNSDYKCIRQTASATTFNVNLEVPWTAAETDLCLVGAARTYRAILPGTPSNGGTQGQAVSVGEDAGFAATNLCAVWPPGTTTTVDIRALRVPSGNPLAGSAKLANGAVAAGAVITATSDRPGFMCSPAADAHHSVHVPMCSATVGADGRYSVVVPASSANSTWAASASLSAHSTETFDRWPNATGLRGDFTLFPLAFDAVVRIIDTSPTGAAQLCGSNGFPVAAWAHDMQGADPNPQNPTVRRTATHQLDSTCLAILPITNWHRDPRPMPAALNQPWPVTSAPFLVASDSENRFGEVVAMLGPRDADRTVTIHMINPETTAATGAFGVKGRLFDVDMADALAGQIGVAARVGAVALDGTCAGAGANVIANATGAYMLPLPCAATYRVTILPMVGSHWKDATFDVALTVDAPVVTRNLGIERTESTLTVTTFRVPSGPTGGIWVDLTNIDTRLDPDGAWSSAAGTAEFTGLPWGIYRIGGNRGMMTTVRYVPPGTDAVTMFTA